MSRLLFIFKDSLEGILLVMPLVLVFWSITKEHKIGLKHRVGLLVFCFFVTTIFSATGIPWLFNLHIDLSINLRLFFGFGCEYGQLILNMFLFVPFGLLLPALWTNLQKIYKIAISGFVLSLFIEVSQIFCFRATDIDDLIMNTLGAVVGYLFFKALQRLGLKDFFAKVSLPQNLQSIKLLKWEPIIYIFMVWLVMSTVQPLVFSRWLPALFM